MTTNELLGLMGPNTLANLIADIQGLGNEAEVALMKIERNAMALLVALIGEDEADELVKTLCD